MMDITKFSCNPFQVNAYLITYENGGGTIVDPGFYDRDELERLYEVIEKNNISIQSVWLTHAHFDHVYGVAELSKKFKCNIYMNHEDIKILKHNHVFTSMFGMKAPDINFKTLNIKEGDILSAGNNKFRVLETPGHTPGGVCFYCEEEKLIFTGDTLFAGSIGRTDNEFGDYDDLISCIMDKLMQIDSETIILPGHGGASSIGKEKASNPFLEPFNEPDELIFEEYDDRE